jgi:hypothetical protein
MCREDAGENCELTCRGGADDNSKSMCPGGGASAWKGRDDETGEWKLKRCDDGPILKALSSS